MSEYKSIHTGEEIDEGINRAINLEKTAGLGTDKIMSQKAVTEELNNKVDKLEGKGLSSNDFTDEMRDKLTGLNKNYLINIEKSWSISSENTYMQTIPVNGVNETDTAVISLEISADEDLADKEFQVFNRIRNIKINNGSITVYIKGNIPDVPIKIRIRT